MLFLNLFLMATYVSAFIYTYITDDLTVTVTQTSFLSTELNGKTYVLSFLEPTITNTVRSASTDYAAELGSDTLAITTYDSSSSGVLQYDTNTVYTKTNSSTTTSSSTTTTSTSSSSSILSTLIATTSSVINTTNVTNSSSKNFAGSLSVKGSLFAGVAGLVAFLL